MEKNVTTVKLSGMNLSIIATLFVLNIGFGLIYDFYNDLILRTIILFALGMLSFIIKKEKHARIICVVVLAILFGKDIYELSVTSGSILQIIASILRLISVSVIFVALVLKLTEPVRNILTQTGTFMYLMAFVLDAAVIAFSLTPSLQRISQYSNGAIFIRAFLGMISWLCIFFIVMCLSGLRSHSKEEVRT